MQDILARHNAGFVLERFLEAKNFHESREIYIRAIEYSLDRRADLDANSRREILNFAWLLSDGLAPTAPPPQPAPDTAASTLIMPESGRGIAFPQDLGWVHAIAESWPAPIAHEYQRLWKIVEANRIEAAVWQLKDTAEVLVKFPTLILARDIIDSGSKEDRNIVRHALFGRMLTFGIWRDLLRDTMAPIARRARGKLKFAQLQDLFFSPDNGNQTPLFKVVCKILEFRNDAFGHGAFRIDLSEFRDEVATLLRASGGEPGRPSSPGLNEALAEAAQGDPWRGTTLRVCDAQGKVLTGWNSISTYRNSSDHEHQGPFTPLVLTGADGRELALWPLIGLRECTRCGKRDTFLYDSRSGESSAADFVLLDYFSGHRMKRKSHQEPELAKEAQQVPFRVLDKEELVGEEFGRTEFEDFLLAKASFARYMAPNYLHSPLAEFIAGDQKCVSAGHAKGVFWLSAPAHVGKSIFVRGLTPDGPKRSVQGAPWIADAVTCRFAIKRELQYRVNELEVLIRHQILELGFGLREKAKRFPQLEVGAADPPAAFAVYIREVMALKPSSVARVVLFLDGLDELQPVAGAGIETFLPEPSCLPNGFYLIVTSRPPAECPDFVRAALERANYGRVPFSRHLTLDPAMLVGDISDDPVAKGYRDLLHQYYDREIEPAIKRAIHEAFAEIRRTQVALREDWDRLSDKMLRKLAMEEWKSFPRLEVGLRQPNAISLADTARTAVAPFREAFATVCVKAGGRFAFVAFLTDLVARGIVEPSAINAVPDEDAAASNPGTSSRLYSKYLEDLKTNVLSTGPDDTKNWDYVRQILVVLAADEEAHQVEAELLRGIFPDHPYRGMSLNALAERIGEPGTTYRLVSAIYSFQTLLAAWRNDSAEFSRYSLGLKDLAITLRALYGGEIDHEHLAFELPLGPIHALPASAEISAERAEALVSAVKHRISAARVRHGPNIPMSDPVVFGPGSKFDDVVSALIAACATRHAARDDRNALVCGTFAHALAVAAQWPRHQKLETFGSIVRTGYLKADAAVLGTAHALRLAREFAEHLVKGGEDADWDDLMSSAEQYCNFAEQIRGDPLALMKLVEAHQSDQLFSAIRAQRSEFWSGILLLAVTPLLRDTGDLERAGAAWQDGLSIIARKWDSDTSEDEGLTPATKVLVEALFDVEQRGGPECRPNKDVTQETASPGTQLSEIPCRKLPWWVYALTFFSGLYVTGLLLIAGGGGFVIYLITMLIMDGPSAKPTPHEQSIGVFFVILIICSILSLYITMPIASLLRWLWRKRIASLARDFAVSLPHLSEARQRRLLPALIRLSVEEFGYQPEWALCRPQWVIQQFRYLSAQPSGAARIIMQAPNYGQATAYALADELSQKDPAYLQELHQLIERKNSLSASNNNNTSAWTIPRILAPSLDHVDNLKPFVAFLNDELERSPSRGAADVKASLQAASSFSLGRAILWSLQETPTQMPPQPTGARWVDRFIRVYSWRRTIIPAFLTLIPLLFIIYDFPQLVIGVFAGRVRDPYDLLAAIRAKEPAACRDILSLALADPDPSFKLARLARIINIGSDGFNLKWLLTPLAKRRIRETVLAQMLILGEDIRTAFWRSFSADAIHRILAKLIRARLVSRSVVLRCMADRKLLGVVRAEKPAVQITAPQDVSERHLDQLRRVLPSALSWSDFGLLTGLGLAATLAWWRILPFLFADGRRHWFLSGEYGAGLAIAICLAVISLGYAYSLFAPSLPGKHKMSATARTLLFQVVAGVAALVVFAWPVTHAIYTASGRAGFVLPPSDDAEWWFALPPTLIGGILVPALIEEWKGAGLFYPTPARLRIQRAAAIGVFVAALPLLAVVTRWGMVHGWETSIERSLDFGSRWVQENWKNPDSIPPFSEVKRVLRFAPDRIEAVTVLAKMYDRRCVMRANTGDLEGAISDCTVAVRLDPHLAKTFGRLSWYLLLVSRPAEAAKAAEKGLVADDSQPWIKTNLAHAYLFMGREAEAEHIYAENKNVMLDGRRFGDAIIEDFAEFRRRGLIPKQLEPELQKIEALSK